MAILLYLGTRHPAWFVDIILPRRAAVLFDARCERAKKIQNSAEVITMRLSKTLLIVAAGMVLLVSGEFLHARAQNSAPGPAPRLIQSGFDIYKLEGPDDAVKAWLKGSLLEEDKQALSQANALRQAQGFFGAYRSYDVVHETDISPSVHILYLAINYEKGPLFAKFNIFRTDHGWILSSFEFNLLSEKLFPVWP
jgi:hypothetical protein